MIQILSEVSGRPKSLVCRVMEVAPVSKEMDDELPDGEGERLLERLRQEKAGILNWLLEGRMKALDDIENIASRN